MTEKHNTKYNTLISEQHISNHAPWSIFTFPGQNEPRSGHGTPWVNSGTVGKPSQSHHCILHNASRGLSAIVVRKVLDLCTTKLIILLSWSYLRKWCSI